MAKWKHMSDILVLSLVFYMPTTCIYMYFIPPNERLRGRKRFKTFQNTCICQRLQIVTIRKRREIHF